MGISPGHSKASARVELEIELKYEVRDKDSTSVENIGEDTFRGFVIKRRTTNKELKRNGTQSPPVDTGT